ncbi:hypothetical protein ACOME3_004488 [Neoechinorhynchus agilis]
MRILFVGNCLSVLDSVFNYVDQVNAITDPFQLLFFIGQCPSDIISSKKTGGKSLVSLPTFYHHSSLSRQDIDLASRPNSLKHPLKDRGVFVAMDGITVIYCFESSEDVKAYDEKKYEMIVDMLRCQLIERPGAKKYADVLITNYPPCGFSKHTDLRVEPRPNSLLASRLACEFKPRYHICPHTHGFERTPYRNHDVLDEQPVHCTRLVILPPFSLNEEIGLLALDLKPLTKNCLQSPRHPVYTTPCPYLNERGEFACTTLMDRSEDEELDDL